MRLSVQTSHQNSDTMTLSLSFSRFVAGQLSALCLLGFALANVGSMAAEVSPLGLAPNIAVERIATVDSSEPVPVPEPSEKAVRFYHSGIVWWLVSVAWSWFVPALILFSGFSGWLGRRAKRIGRWEVTATFVFILLYFLVDYVLSLPINYFREFVRLHDYDLSTRPSPGGWITR
jgi:hypothetical protein